jgi:hypothetical protein
MTTKTKTRSGPTAPRPEEELQTGPWLTPAFTTEERLQRIRAMSTQIGGYVEYIARVANLSGTSAEAKEKAVLAFYERMVVMERQLSRVKDELHLG